MKRERRIEPLPGIMSRRAYDLAAKKFGIYTKNLADQQIELGAAGGTNDFHDNAAFDEANRLIDVIGISYATWREAVMHPTFIEPRQETDTVQIGNLVEIELVDFNDRFKMSLLGPVDAILFKEDVISYASPLGQAILGKTKGTQVEYEATNRKYRAQIIDILPGNF